MDPTYVRDLVPSILSYEKVIKNYEKGIKKGDFYEETLGGDLNYPDW